MKKPMSTGTKLGILGVGVAVVTAGVSTRIIYLQQQVINGYGVMVERNEKIAEQKNKLLAEQSQTIETQKTALADATTKNAEQHAQIESMLVRISDYKDLWQAAETRERETSERFGNAFQTTLAAYQDQALITNQCLETMGKALEGSITPTDMMIFGASTRERLMLRDSVLRKHLVELFPQHGRFGLRY